MIDPPKDAIYFPKNKSIFKCSHPGCGATGTWEVLVKHQRQTHSTDLDKQK